MKKEQYYCEECGKIHKKTEVEEKLYEEHQMYKMIGRKNEEKISLNDLILSLRDQIEEEFDMMELIEDELKSIFECNLNCMTCSDEERSQCLQNFKKANVYWLRKIAQDEYIIKDIVEKLDELREFITEMYEELQRQMDKESEMKPISEFTKKVDKRDKEEKKEDLDYFQ